MKVNMCAARVAWNQEWDAAWAKRMAALDAVVVAERRRDEEVNYFLATDAVKDAVWRKRGKIWRKTTVAKSPAKGIDQTCSGEDQTPG